MDNFGTPSQKILQDLLKKIRVEAGFRQVDLAKKLNVPQSRISKYELGERRIDLLEFRAICAALGKPFLECVRELEEELAGKTDETN